MTATRLVAAPRARMRNRVRAIDLTETPEDEKAIRTRCAQAQALKVLELAEQKKQITNQINKLTRKLAAQHGSGEIDDFTVEFSGKVYAGREFTEEQSTIDIRALHSEVPQATFLTIVSATQSAVSGYGGKNLLNKVLRVKQKPPEFKIKVSK